MTFQCVGMPKGSSPLTRGALPTSTDHRPSNRLIPAHAGSTLSKVCQRAPTWAHPRSRGEHLTTASLLVRTSGSSPLTRGALPHLPVVETRCGLIPAHAGSTFLHRGFASPARAHPRSRGEHWAAAYTVFWFLGSSPLTRGAPGDSQPGDPPVRLIPAHAGSTWVHPRGNLVRGAHPRSRGEHGSRTPATPSG